jgi:gluconolactonase
VPSSFRLLPIALFSVSLFAIDRLRPVVVAQFPSYASAVTFDYSGSCYVSQGRAISRVTSQGIRSLWAETGAPKGHKVLPDGTHLVCDASHRAVLRLNPQGKILGNASSDSEGKPLREPNDLTLDPKGGFYFTDTGGARDRAMGSIHFVDTQGKTHVAAGGLQSPTGIVLRPDGRTLLVAESQRNRILTYDVMAPGRLGPMKVLADLGKASGQVDKEPYGMCLDQHGNLYIAHRGTNLIDVLSRKGRLIRQYPAGMPSTSGLAFGGPKVNLLYMSGGLGSGAANAGAVFQLDLRSVRGAR